MARKLVITAEADVSKAKAAIRTVSAEQAKAQAAERAANAAAAASASEAAKRKVLAAQAASKGTKEERAELKRLQAEYKQLAAAARLARMDARDARAQVAGGVSDMPRQAARARTLARAARPAPLVDADTRAAMGQFGKFAGPAALVAAISTLVKIASNIVTEMREARKERLGKAVATGAAQDQLAKDLKAKRFKTEDITRIVAATEGFDGVASTAELAEAARAELSRPGTRDPNRIIQAMARAAQGGPEITEAQRVANTSRRLARAAEIQMLSPGGYSEALAEQAAQAGLDYARATGRGTGISRAVGSVARGVGAGAVTQAVLESTVSAGVLSPKALIEGDTAAIRGNVIQVRLPPDQLRQIAGPQRLGGR